MLTIISNAPKSDLFAPWEVTSEAIVKGKISLPYKGLEPRKGDLATNTNGLMEVVTEEKLFLEFDRVNLAPSITKSTTDKSYKLLLVTEVLAAGEKVVFVRSDKGYLLEWNHNVLSGHFDAIVAFRASHQETSVVFYIANEKGQVREIKLSRKPDSETVSIKRDGFKDRPEIRTDKRLSILPYRPYKPTKHIIAHRTQIAKAKELLSESDGYVIHEYLHLKSARELSAKLKAEGITAVTIFYNEDGLINLTDDQRFFTRAVAEYFHFVNISYKGVSLTRYFFNGKTTLPKRKQPSRKPGKKPFGKKPTGDKKNPTSGKKYQGSKKFDGRPSKIKNSSTYGANGSVKPSSYTKSK